MPKIMCYVCSSASSQIKIMLTCLRQKLQKLSHEYVPDFRDEGQGQNKDRSGFSRLLSIMFGDEKTSNLQVEKCSHDKFNRYLRRKLKCDSQALHNLCNELIQKLSEKNYHLEILSSQIKSISHTSISLSKQSGNANFIHKKSERIQIQPDQLIKFGTVRTGIETNQNIKQIMQNNQQQKCPEQNQQVPFYQMTSLPNILQGFHIQPNFTFLDYRERIQNKLFPPRD